MPTWNYWHRIEYRRETANGNGVPDYTEVVQDQGWMFERRADRREQWFVTYTRACAEDFLDRVHAPPGTWVVTVWHTGVSPEGKGRLRGAIRIKRAKNPSDKLAHDN